MAPCIRKGEKKCSCIPSTAKFSQRSSSRRQSFRYAYNIRAHTYGKGDLSALQQCRFKQNARQLSIIQQQIIGPFEAKFYRIGYPLRQDSFDRVSYSKARDETQCRSACRFKFINKE